MNQLSLEEILGLCKKTDTWERFGFVQNVWQHSFPRFTPARTVHQGQWLSQGFRGSLHSIELTLKASYRVGQYMQHKDQSTKAFYKVNLKPDLKVYMVCARYGTFDLGSYKEQDSSIRDFYKTLQALWVEGRTSSEKNNDGHQRLTFEEALHYARGILVQSS